MKFEKPLIPPQSPEAKKEAEALAEEGGILGARDRIKKEKEEKKMTAERKEAIRQKTLAEKGILAAKDAVEKEAAKEKKEKALAEEEFLEEKRKRAEEERTEKLESARSLSDIRLRYERADYVDQKDNEQKRLEVTEGQVESARKEMERELYKKEHGGLLRRAAAGAGGAIGGFFFWLLAMIVTSTGWSASKFGKWVEKKNPWRPNLK